MVDLDQCTHATINGWDKERRGWYPLPSSLSSSICLPWCPPCCPLPNCFSPMIAHLHLCWHPPGHGLSWCWGAADGEGASWAVCGLQPPPSTCSMGELWALSSRLIMSSRFHLLVPLTIFPLSECNIVRAALTPIFGFRPRDFLSEGYRLIFGLVMLRSETDPTGRWGNWGEPKWVKDRNTGEKVEQRSDWVNPRWMEVGQGARC